MGYTHYDKDLEFAFSMSLLISFAFGLNFAGSSLSSESADAKTVGAIFDIGDEVSDFNSENLTILYDRINRGSTTYKELSDSLGTENGKVLRTSARLVLPCLLRRQFRRNLRRQCMPAQNSFRIRSPHICTGTTGGSRGEQTYAVLLGSNGNSFYTDNVNSSGGRLGSGTTYVSYGVLH